MTTEPAADSPLLLLSLPRVQLLADLQLRGVTCVWCGVAVMAGDVHDLGPRPRPGGGQWFPRGCTRCVQATARRVIGLHDKTCTRCSPGRPCEARAALRGLLREGRRHADH
ncbi:hypothetical protein [Streptomyces sp. NPDC057877]|uniref:hypothetical protein n=1 Tax=Streptomyces sp. NPDC057877 TaxID=3346269 RepID=UPI0036C401FE